MLEEATNDQVWQVPSSQLQELADHSYNDESYRIIMQAVWKKLNYQGQLTKSIEKTLLLLDYLVKNGASRCITEGKLEINVIKQLAEFSWFENGTDKGKLVRERAEALVKLLTDDQKLEFERENAKKLKEKIKAFSYSNESLPPHLNRAQSAQSNDQNSQKTNGLGGLWEEGKKIVMNQFKATQYAVELKEAEDLYAEGEYDLEALPGLSQKDNEWPDFRRKKQTGNSADTNTTPKKEGVSSFETQNFGFGSFKKSKSEVQAENAKEVKKKWEQVEQTFLQFEAPVANTNKPTIFGEIEPNQTQYSGNRRAFEDWWEQPSKSDASSKENARPNKVLMVTDNNLLDEDATVSKWSTCFNANKPAQQKPNPADWFDSNPFDYQANGAPNYGKDVFSQLSF